MKFRAYKQQDAMDCGPTCLKMIAHFYGKDFTLDYLRDRCDYSKYGVSLLRISEAAEAIGFRIMNVSVDLEKIIREAPLPFIAHWKQGHFIVVYKITRTTVYVADPAFGLVKYKLSEFKSSWVSTKDEESERGICLLLQPTPKFYDTDEEGKVLKSDTGFKFIFRYFSIHKKLVYQLIIGMVVGSIIQLIFPFLTQSIVDRGINQQNISFLYVILAAQLMLFISRSVVDFLRSWILLYIGQRINISMVSDFLFKLMKMPLAFFDTKMLGDIMQRIGDHTRIEQFLTSSTLNTIFSFVNLLIFGAVLLFYSIKIFAVFIVGSLLYIFWTTFFLKQRRSLDFKRFAKLSQNQNALFQMINGMQEIKLHNCENEKRFEWEGIQSKLFKINMQGLKLSQYQQAGAVFINETKNIVITFLSAIAVIRGEISLGMMLSIQYIIGQMNSPIEQLVGFVSAAQDAKISVERLTEIHNKRDEQDEEDKRTSDYPLSKSIVIDRVSFHYSGMQEIKTLKDVTLTIPEGKVTAIVGSSGSGKTTLLKLLLGFYSSQNGDILVGGQKLLNLNQKMWRQKCGVVMQDGFIFSDSIEKNIALGEKKIDRERLYKASELACVREFIDTLPNGFQTVIGADGQGISAGQRQRMLIARAIYKNPEYLFFDEATNALDANNERKILENLDTFFKGKTVIVVAHRLSTVKNADQIIVLEKGQIIERGSHIELSGLKGSYYNLVKNQLEIGN
ncbi:MAG: peptidase domain-containing ABC transporter [Bacteroidia bacterium]